MSKRALVPVNVLASGTQPAGQHAGDLFYNSSDNAVYVYDGANWTPISGGALDGGSVDSNFGGVNPIDGGGITG